MGFLDDLPGEIQFTATLAPITGDAAAGTGLAGVLKLLESMDPESASSFLTSKLDGSLNASLSVGEGGITGDVAAHFDRAVEIFQRDPLELAAPLMRQIGGLQDVALSQLPASLTTRVDGLNAMVALVPADSTSLFTAAATALDGVKQTALSGPLDELRQWSVIVAAIRDAITPLIAGGAGTVADRLIAFLVDLLRELLRAILPEGAGIATSLGDRLDAAFTVSQFESVNAIKLELIGHLDQARALFAAGNFTDTSHLVAAQASLNQLGSLLGGISGSLNEVLSLDVVAAGGLATALTRQLDRLDDFEFVDLANFEKKFKDAVASIEAAIASLHLESVRTQVTDLFDRLQQLIADSGLATLTAELTDLQSTLQSAVATLDGALLEAVAAIQGIFSQAGAALAEITSALGTVENGQFHFHVEEQLESFLAGVKTTIEETVQPALDTFQTTIADALDQVETQLAAVQDAIDSVISELQTMMQDVVAQLQALDVPARMEEIRGRLATMNDSLGAIDFSIVVDPVIAEIESMRDTLAKIDVSSMSEITLGALKVSVTVITEIDFSTAITDFLMAKFDEILKVPTDLAAQVEGEVNAAVTKLADFGPELILQPLDTLFAPVQKGVEALSLEPLLEPIDRWHRQTVTAVAAVTPGALLQPVVAQYDTLATAVAKVDPAELVKPLGDVISELSDSLSGAQLTEPLAGLTGLLDRVKTLVASLSPGQLLAPLIDAFDTVMAALDQFRPSVLLAPVAEVFDLITAPVNALTAAQASALRDAFAPIRELPDAFDPRPAFARAQQAYTTQRARLTQLNLGGLLADIKGPYDQLSLSFQAAGPGGVSLSASVTALNPLQDPALGQAIAALSQAQSRLDAALAQAAPPAELVTRFESVKGKLEALIPSWAAEGTTVAKTKEGIKAASPLSLLTTLDGIYDALLDQLSAFDPRVLQTELEETFAPLNDLLQALNLDAIVTAIQEALVAVVDKLGSLALGTIVEEAQAAFAIVQQVVAGLDPRPVIAALDGLTAEVTDLLNSLQPSTVLAGIAGPSAAAKAIVQSFNPSIFKEPLETAHEELQRIVAQIDVGILLEPLLARLKELRDALEAALRRTEAAFNEMLAAIPV